MLCRYPPYWNSDRLTHKLIRLLLPMLFFGIVFTVLISGISISSVIGFLLAPAKNGYWYLMSLSVFYISLQVFRFFPANNWKSDLSISVLIWLAFLIIWKYTSQQSDPFCMLDCGNYYPFFILGVFTTKYHLIDKLRQHNSIYSIALIGYLVLMIIPAVGPHALQSLTRHIFIPLCAVIVVTVLFESRHGKTSRVEEIVEYVGRHTLDIYVIHYFLLITIHLSAVDRWLTSTANSLVSLCLSATIALLVVAISIGIGLILHRSHFVDKMVFGNLK